MRIKERIEKILKEIWTRGFKSGAENGINAVVIKPKLESDIQIILVEIKQELIRELQYENPYPEDIFIEPSQEQFKILNEKLKEVGLTIDRFSGSIGRMIWKGFNRRNQEAITKLCEEKE